ncbi:MAG: bifunctional enoyl-CoA hydratase/phosphate acetyltransferase [Thermomonas sp.]
MTQLPSARELLDACKSMPALRTAIVHPVKANAIQSAFDAAAEGLIEPVLIGPQARIVAAAAEAGVDISGWQLYDVEHSHAAAEYACALAVQGDVQALMKGSLHSDELLAAVIAAKPLRTERRMSHVYAFIDAGYHKPFFITDGVINLTPTLAEKADIVRNAVHLFKALNGAVAVAKVAVVTAVETVNPDMPATIDAACLSKMAQRGQIEDALIDGPLAFDNAISREAADEKGIVSDVAGDADVLLMPNMEAGNMMAKQLIFLGKADAAGLVLGARVPIILTSRADSRLTRLMSCVLAVRVAFAREHGMFS